jgi:hypothetical protein
MMLQPGIYTFKKLDQEPLAWGGTAEPSFSAMVTFVVYVCSDMGFMRSVLAIY